MAIAKAISGSGLGLKHESVSGRPFPYQGGSEKYNPTLAGIGTCTTAGQVYLQGSS